MLIWQFKQQIIKVQRELLKDNTKNDSSWLQDCLKPDTCMSIIPTTSKSSEYISNKRANTNSLHQPFFIFFYFFVMNIIIHLYTKLFSPLFFKSHFTSLFLLLLNNYILKSNYSLLYFLITLIIRLIITG
jgi:hypothetical protein